MNVARQRVWIEKYLLFRVPTFAHDELADLLARITAQVEEAPSCKGKA